MRLAPLWPVSTTLWSERWEAPQERLRELETRLRLSGACVLRGDPHDRWDFEVRGGILGAARLLMGMEDHPGGKQLIRLRWWPDVPVRGPLFALGLGALTVGAARGGAWEPAVALGLGALLPVLHIVAQCMAAMGTIGRAVKLLRRGVE